MNNQGINFEQSVSWTSGNAASYNMYSDSYYNSTSDFGWYNGESERNEIDQNKVDDDESWKQFNDMLPRSNGTSSSYSSGSSNSYSYPNSDSYWSSSEAGNTISSDSSFSSSSVSSTTSSCSSCSETYQNSALVSSEQNYRRNKRRNNIPNEPKEPVGVWRYQNGQLVTLEENADIDGYFMNLSQAEEEMMRNKMCDAEGGFWCN